MNNIFKKFLIVSFLFVSSGNILYASFDLDSFKCVNRMQINALKPLMHLSSEDAESLYNSGDADIVFLTILSQTIRDASYMNIAKHVVILGGLYPGSGSDKDVYYTEDSILKKIRDNYSNLSSMLYIVLNDSSLRNGLEDDVSFFINNKFIANTWLRKTFGANASLDQISIKRNTFTQLDPVNIHFKTEDFYNEEGYFMGNYARLVCGLQNYILDYLENTNNIGKASEKFMHGVEKAIGKGLKKLFKF